jgi:hypothetical protein
VKEKRKPARKQGRIMTQVFAPAHFWTGEGKNGVTFGPNSLRALSVRATGAIGTEDFPVFRG